MPALIAFAILSISMMVMVVAIADRTKFREPSIKKYIRKEIPPAEANYLISTERDISSDSASLLRISRRILVIQPGPAGGASTFSYEGLLSIVMEIVSFERNEHRREMFRVLVVIVLVQGIICLFGTLYFWRVLS